MFLFTICKQERILMSTVISLRIPKWLKEKLEKYGIDIPNFIRRKLEEEVEKIEQEEIEKLLNELKEVFKGIDPYELSKLVDEE